MRAVLLALLAALLLAPAASAELTVEDLAAIRGVIQDELDARDAALLAQVDERLLVLTGEVIQWRNDSRAAQEAFEESVNASLASFDEDLRSYIQASSLDLRSGVKADTRGIVADETDDLATEATVTDARDVQLLFNIALAAALAGLILERIIVHWKGRRGGATRDDDASDGPAPVDAPRPGTLLARFTSRFKRDSAGREKRVVKHGFPVGALLLEDGDDPLESSQPPVAGDRLEHQDEPDTLPAPDDYRRYESDLAAQVGRVLAESNIPL